MIHLLGKQTTLAARAILSGFGVHSGKPATIVISPAGADTGIVFVRTDAGQDVEILAHFENVVSTELCTVVGAEGLTVATIEHIMAAFRAAGVDNAIVEIDGPEMPIADGCSDAFLDLIDDAGVVGLKAARKAIRILKPVRIEVGDAVAEFLPFEGTRYDVTIDFKSELIGRQSYVLDLTSGSFRKDIARARTFGFMKDVERLWELGYALGSSLENSVAIGEDRVLNPEGLRYNDEFVRHKTLDAVGDLALAGMPFVGLFRSYKGGHRMNLLMLKELFADASAYEIVNDQVVRAEPARGGVMVQASVMAPVKS
jgi:UDP-3-O-[3-hydroxymyristoyl] N-acetylglucosamine deacetylase